MTLIGPNTRSAPSPALALDQNRDALIRWTAVAVLVLAVFACLSPALSGEFLVWDDFDNLVNNTRWRGLSPGHLRWMFTTNLLGHYQPLTWLSFAVDYTLWGMDPGGYHFTNILLHAVNAVLFFLLARRLMHLGVAGEDPGRGGGTRPELTATAALAAAFWALHPLRVESVAWATERRDVLSTAFMLGSGLAYLGAVQVGSPRLGSWRSYGIACALLLLSCLSKAWGMSFFVVLLLLDMYPLRRIPLNPLRWLSGPSLRVVLEKAPMIVIGAATAVAAARAQHAANAAKTLSQWPLEGRLLQSVYGLWFYARQTVAPADLSPLYQLPVEINPWEPRYLAAYAFALVAAGYLVIWWRRRPGAPGPIVAAAAYAVTLAPVLGVLQSGDQMVADRYSYIAAMPLSIMVALGALAVYRLVLSRAKDHAPRAAMLLWIFGGVGLAALGALTFSQAAVWQSTLTLWQHATRAAPCSFAFDYLGDELLRRGERDEAGERFRQATELWPGDGRAWFCLANVLKEQGRITEAEQAYLRAIPILNVAYQAHQNLGIMYVAAGRKEEGYRQFELAVADLEDAGKGRRPLSGGPYMVLGLARKEQGRVDEAAELFRKALGYPDTYEAARGQLGSLGR